MTNSQAGTWLKSQKRRWRAGAASLVKQANGRRLSDLTDRELRAIGALWETVKDFVESHRRHDGRDCLCVPAAIKGVPASVSHCGKKISAAKYMLLLTQGTPKSGGMVTRHLCGNGHLSCVNPNHLVWGTPGDNISDMVKHWHAGDNVQDRIHSID